MFGIKALLLQAYSFCQTFNTILMLKLHDGFIGERSIILPAMILKTCEEHPLLRRLHITDIGYYPHAMYHYRERANGVGQYILIYCQKGCGWFTVNGQHFDVRAGQWFVIPAGMPHAYASDNNNPWTIYWVHFTGEDAPAYGDGCLTPKEINACPSSRIADRNALFEELFKALSDSRSTESLLYASSLLHTYLASFRYLSAYRKCSLISDNAEGNDIVTMAVRYMHENLERSLTLADICHFTGYGQSQISLLFRNKTGQSPINYFNKLRMQQACKLLETTDMKINQICSKVGIDDCYYFSRLFTKTVGIPPKLYRQRSCPPNLRST